MKRMAEFGTKKREFEGAKRRSSSNVKSSGKYERFGDTIRYLTWEEWLRFLDSIDNYRHKLMLRMIYELGCRVGEFVRIQLEHIDFKRGRVFFPKENTKTGRRRVSRLPMGLVNELKSWLKQDRRMSIREERIARQREYIFSPWSDFKIPYTENRILQIFRRYAAKAGLQRAYGKDSMGLAVE